MCDLAHCRCRWLTVDADGILVATGVGNDILMIAAISSTISNLRMNINIRIVAIQLVTVLLQLTN